MISREELSKIIQNLNNVSEFDSIIAELEKTIGEFEVAGKDGQDEIELWREKYDALEEKYRTRFSEAVLETKKEVENIVKKTVEEVVENEISLQELDFDGSTES